MTAPNPACGYCEGGPVLNAAMWTNGRPRPPAACPRCGGVFARVRFTANDTYGLWRRGDRATYLGRESDDPDAEVIDVFDLHGETIALTDAFGRGLVEVDA